MSIYNKKFIEKILLYIKVNNYPPPFAKFGIFHSKLLERVRRVPERCGAREAVICGPQPVRSLGMAAFLRIFE